MKTESSSADSLVFERDFEESPEKVWRALTEPRWLAAWLQTDEPPRAGSDAQPAPLQPSVAGEAEDSDATDRRVREVSSSDYEVVAAQPHRLVRYRWRDRDKGLGHADGSEVHSVVTVELAPRPAGGTHLRLTHGEFRIVPAAPFPTAAPVRSIASARRWRTATVSLGTRCLLRWAA